MLAIAGKTAGPNRMTLRESMGEDTLGVTKDKKLNFFFKSIFSPLKFDFL